MCLRRKCDSISDAFLGSYDNYMDVEYSPVLLGHDVLFEDSPFGIWPSPVTSGQNGANEIHHAILNLLHLLPTYEQEVADLTVAVANEVGNGVADSGKNEDHLIQCYLPANEYDENYPEEYFLYIEDFLCDDDDNVEDEDEETETGIQGENLKKEVQEDEIDRKVTNAQMEIVAHVEKEIQEELEEKKQNAHMESVACAGEDSPVTYIESITIPTYSNATMAASASDTKKKYLSDGERIDSESITANENVKVVENGIKMGNVEDIKG